MSRSPSKALVVGLGGNLGGSACVAERMCSAIKSLSNAWGPASMSSFYVSEPVGPIADQPEFLNAVAAFWPLVMPRPEATLVALQTLESKHGRERLVVGGARTLDLDLLLHGGSVLNSPNLHVPHPRMGERAFVLEPLSELFGDAFSWGPKSVVGELLASPSVARQGCRRSEDPRRHSLRLETLA